MKIHEIMTKELITVRKDQNLRDVLALMREHKVTKIPVVDGDKLLGIVTDGKIVDKLGRERSKGLTTSSLHASSVMERDFLRATPDQDVDELMADLGKPGLTMIPICKGDLIVGVVTKSDMLQLVHGDRPVEQLMQKQVLFVAPGERLVHARRLLLDNDIARLPVLDHGAVRGILSEVEIANAFADFKESDAHVQKASVRELEVQDHMQVEVIKGTPKMTAKEAARTMMEHHVGALPIVDENNVIQGIVTRTDLIRDAVQLAVQ